MKTKQVLIGLVGLAAAVVAMETQAATLKIGDPAPKLQAGKWVQGEPVTQFEPGTAYILSFWATRSAPCLLSTPHLNEVWTKFKDKGLVVIGQHVWEQDESQVPAFIKKLGDKMTYRVALDNRQGSERGKMAEAWIEAAGVRGVPVVFVVDKQGRVAWIGRPLLLKDSVIEEVLAGKWDLAKAAADCEKAMRDEAQVARLSQQLQQAMQDKQWAKAETTLAEIARLVPQDQREGVESLGVTILLRKGDPAAAAKLADTLSLRH